MPGARRAALLILAALTLPVPMALEAQGLAAARAQPAPILGTAAAFHSSVAARDVASAAIAQQRIGTIPTRINPQAGDPNGPWRATWHPAEPPVDPLIRAPLTARRTPPLDFRFQGARNPEAFPGAAPPDTVGDVGPNHYVQAVNRTKVLVFDKAGHLLAPPIDLGDLWPGGACARNVGDPVVLYDRMADRWLLSQVSLSLLGSCVAISRTGDPLGGYFLYDFDMGGYPDYLKFGVWADSYLASASEGGPPYTAYAFDRAEMLAGDPSAGFVKFTGVTNFMLPADIDGPTPPPGGTPGYFYTFKDQSFHGGGPDRIELYALDVDPNHPGQSTFTLEGSFRVPPFPYTVCGYFISDCVRQRNTDQRIQPVSEWPMHRFPYINFGDHQTLLGNFTVGGGTGETGAAIRWFELRNTAAGWRPYQQGTYDPGDGNDRFMGSIAMDGAGNIALGFSVSSSAIFPSIHYATRAPGDPPGTFRSERALVNGRGSQTREVGWGHYSAMSVDPANDCSFWYTNEFYPISHGSNWHTAVGVFTVPGC